MPSAILPNDTAIADPATFKVAIIGGGIGGLTTALSIARQNPTLQNITVFEQAPAYKEIGAGIGIGVNAARILKKLGVWDAANAVSGERNGLHRSCRRFDTGEEIVAVGAMDEDGAGGVRQLSVHRAEILDVLYQELRRNYAGRVSLETDMPATKVKVCPPSQPTHMNNSLTSHYQDNGDEVTIHFANITKPTATANLVLACDGIHSAIRSQFALDKPRYSGRIAYRGLLPLSAIHDRWPYPSYAVSWLARDKHFLVFPISRNQTLNVVAFVTKPETELGELKESWTSSAPREELEREYEGWEPMVGAIIREMQARPGKWRLNDRELLEDWTYFDGKVVLAGDAAHAMLPHQGLFPSPLYIPRGKP
jgi:salicylate hydroxylase